MDRNTTMSGLVLHNPAWLVLLLILPLVLRTRNPSRGAAALRYPARSLLGSRVRAPRLGPGARLVGLRLASSALLVLALSRPQLEKSESREDTRGINLVLALDFSGTMRTRDFLLDGRRVSRSDGLKRICGEFVRARPNDRIGLVSFDRDAFLAAPLTLDHTWLLERLSRETNGIGTAVGSALVVAADHLQKHTNETRVIVVMTDAENLSAGPRPDVVAEALIPLRIRIHVVQILSPNEADPLNDLSAYFTQVAARTGGEYFRVRTGAHLRSVYAQIDRLEKQKLSDRRAKSYRELFPWLGIPALLLLVLEQILAHTIWRRLP